jgi:hypothetical protein
MVCPMCQSASVSVIPAEIRLYRDSPRTMSHPPIKPSPDLLVCLDCGCVEFSIPPTWLSAGWLRPMRPQNVSAGKSIAPANEVAARGLVPLPAIEMAGD